MIFFYITVLSFFDCFFKLDRTLKYISLISVVLLLGLLAGLRGIGVGPDDFNYYEQYINAPTLSDWFNGVYSYSYQDFHMEPGYIFITSLAKEFNLHFHFILSFFALLTVSITIYFCNKYSMYVFISILLYYSHVFLYREMNQIRAGLAIAILFFSMMFLCKRKYFFSTIVVIIAMLFHLASIVMIIPILLLKFWSTSRKQVLILFFVSFLVGLFNIFGVLMDNFPNIPIVTEKITGYLNSSYANTTSFLDQTNIKNIVFFFLFLANYKTLQTRIPNFDVIFLYFSLFVSWRLAFSAYGILAGRFATFFGLTEILLVPSLISILRYRLFSYIVVLLYIFLVFYSNIEIKRVVEPYF